MHKSDEYRLAVSANSSSNRKSAVNPLLESVKILSDANPTNPFLTPAYAQARLNINEELDIIFDTNGAPITVAFFKKGLASSLLEIPSFPSGHDTAGIVTSLLKHCRLHGIRKVQLNTFASSAVSFPSLSNLTERKRSEFILQKDGPTFDNKLAESHRRNIRKAEKAGITFKKLGPGEGLTLHAECANSSFARRREKGQHVPEASSFDWIAPYLETQCAQIYQAYLDGEVLSSLVILQAPAGAYYLSAGTTDKGSSLGSSYALTNHVIKDLEQHNISHFNLGGAGPTETGLIRFKAGFGSFEVKLQNASVVASRLPRRVLARLKQVLFS